MINLRIHFVIFYCYSMLFLVSFSPQSFAGEPKPLFVFAAASTTNAINDIGKLFEEKGLGKMKPSFASSSTLAKQISHGAPAQVFISANPKWMDFLEREDLIEPATRFDLLSNRIVLIAPCENRMKVEIGTGFPLAELLGNGYLAMGDPDHVPAGIYGKKALERLNVWESVSSKIARTGDVRAALTLVENGESPLGIVYATDAAISKRVKIVGMFPDICHPRIAYPAAIVVDQRNPLSMTFLNFLKSPDAAVIFKTYGFMVIH